MRSSAVALVLLLVNVCACKSDPGAPEPAVEPAALAIELNIASTPSEAKVLLEGAELGTTPYRLKLKKSTQLTVEKAGYVPQTLTLGPDSEPNVVVKLTPLEAVPAVAPAGDSAKAPAAEEPRPAGPVFDTVTKAKAALKSGRIDRVKYDQVIRQLKTRSDLKLDKLKELYQKGRIDKVEYKRREAVIESEYKG
ncbi:MAG: PEGA domain-containing protein [Deltaproteobacteria bacterium]|nr:PEGA domain-containing protein [Deltaproteobacteria bacterium]